MHGPDDGFDDKRVVAVLVAVASVAGAAGVMTA